LSSELSIKTFKRLEAQWAEPVPLTLHCFDENLYRTFHRCSLPNFGSFGYSVSEEKILLKINQPETRISYGGHVC
jgi:hypothetical protein